MSLSPGSRPAGLLHSGASPESLALLRIWVFGFWLVNLLAAPLTIHAAAPREAFEPFSLLQALPTSIWDLILSEQGLIVGQVVLVLVVLCAMLGVGSSGVMALAALGVVVQQGMVRAYGYVNHAELPMLYATVILAASPCADALTIWGKQRVRRVAAYQLPLVGIAGLMLLTYTLIGTHRLVYGGPGLFLSDDLQAWVIRNNLVRPPVLPWLTAWFDQRWFWPPLKLGFPLITLLEISAGLALVSHRFRVFFIWSMISVHTMIWLLMGIRFSNEVMLYIVLIDSRRWSPVHQQVRGQLLVLFDGFCSLCDSFVAVLLARDPGRILRFAPLQGATAAERLGSTVVGPADPETIIVVDEEGQQQRSAAVLRAVSALGGKWAFAAVLGLVPRWISDRGYEFVARNRYRWFPRRETCRLPTPEERAVFLP